MNDFSNNTDNVEFRPKKWMKIKCLAAKKLEEQLKELNYQVPKQPLHTKAIKNQENKI